MLMPDGKLGMLDFGMVKVLNDHERLNIAQVLVAHRHGNLQAQRAALEAAGVHIPTSDNAVPTPEDVELVTKLAEYMVDTKGAGDPNYESPTVDTLRTSLKSLPKDIYFYFRTIMLLRKVLHVIQYDISVVRVWQDLADRTVKELAAKGVTNSATAVLLQLLKSEETANAGGMSMNPRTEKRMIRAHSTFKSRPQLEERSKRAIKKLEELEDRLQGVITTSPTGAVNLKKMSREVKRKLKGDYMVVTPNP
eukprot:scaffold14_cov380-Prasinococcus_capsulatus_cf.AAC.11